MYILVLIPLFIFVFIPSIRALAIRSSRNHPTRSLYSIGREAHSFSSIDSRDVNEKRNSLNLDQKTSTFREIYETYNAISTTIGSSVVIHETSMETNVLLHPRKRQNSGNDDSGCCSGDDVHISISCSPCPLE